MKKNVMLAVLALVLMAVVLLGVNLLGREAPVDGGKQITVTVVHKDGTEKVFTYSTDEGYLGPVLLENKLVDGEQGEYGLYIHAVDGETADYNVDQGWWALYVGEEMATTGADQIVINDGDSFRLVYTIG